MGNVYIFSDFGISRNTSHNFLTLSSGVGVLSCLLQCKNHCKLSVLGCVLKLEVVEGRLRKDNLDFYYSSELMKCKSIYGYYDASITQKVVKPDTLDRV